jgi:hypothetical protein
MLKSTNFSGYRLPAKIVLEIVAYQLFTAGFITKCLFTVFNNL